MKAYTVKAAGVEVGVPVDERTGMTQVGEPGRGRRLVQVPLPQGAVVTDGRLVEAPGSGTILYIPDMSGFRGSWSLDWGRSEPTVIARGWAAQGDAGRMGGGPAYLLVVPPGWTALATRSGRLYGGPERVRICVGPDGVPTVEDADAAAATAEAAAAWPTA